mmetsp:Transcript_7457/g.21756  ORF Transcript_7457/g.21756 Transcript_7457/m.21756 type:complete len:274 (-) Transcript_7457:112-933(-)
MSPALCTGEHAGHGGPEIRGTVRSHAPWRVPGVCLLRHQPGGHPRRRLPERHSGHTPNRPGDTGIAGIALCPGADPVPRFQGLRQVAPHQLLPQPARADRTGTDADGVGLGGSIGMAGTFPGGGCCSCSCYFSFGGRRGAGALPTATPPPAPDPGRVGGSQRPHDCRRNPRPGNGGITPAEQSPVHLWVGTRTRTRRFVFRGPTPTAILRHGHSVRTVVRNRVRRPPDRQRLFREHHHHRPGMVVRQSCSLVPALGSFHGRAGRRVCKHWKGD